MSESAAAEPAVTPPAEPAEVTPAQDVDFWKSKARDWEKRAKENKTAAEKLAEIEESKKSETQKLQEQLAELQSRAATAERDRERLAIIARHGIPEDYQDLVQGADADALEASAAKVKSLIQANAQPQQSASFVIPDEGGSPNLALNGDGIESALRNALGIR